MRSSALSLSPIDLAEAVATVSSRGAAATVGQVAGHLELEPAAFARWLSWRQEAAFALDHLTADPFRADHGPDDPAPLTAHDPIPADLLGTPSR